MDVLERIDAAHPPPRADRAAAARCSASSPAAPDSTCLFHALRELGYRVSALHVEPRAARRRVRRGRALLRRAARRRGRPSSTRPASARPSCASSATASRPTACARPATRRATRSRRSSTGSSRAAPRRASSRGARTASSARCCRSGARRPRPSAATRGLEFRVDSSNPDTTRGLIRDEILPLLERIHPAARENILRALETRRTMPPALAELLDTPGRVAARRPRRRRPGRARARPPLARARARSSCAARSLGRLAHPLRPARP